MSKNPNALDAGMELGTFRIESLLGAGGCGITYRAFDARLDRTVAIKEYCPRGRAEREDGIARLGPASSTDREPYRFGLDKFMDEARTLAKFAHPNIVRVNDLIEANGTAYIVMEYEHGDTLNRLVKRRGQLTERQSLAVCMHMLRGLAAIHSQDFLHRDVKPANILIRRSGPPVLLDFGAARHALGEHGDPVAVVVTPGYAPVEQYDANAHQGPWTDLYGLGATLYHTLCGTAPAPSTWRAAAVQAGRPDPVIQGIRFIRSFAAPVFADAVDWMLQISVADRPANAHMLLRQLIPHAREVRQRNAASRTLAGVASTDDDAGQVVPPEAPRDTTIAAVDPHLQRAAQDVMLRLVGPIAPLVIDREATRANSANAFATALAGLLESDAERETLAHALRPHLPRTRN